MIDELNVFARIFGRVAQSVPIGLRAVRIYPRAGIVKIDPGLVAESDARSFIEQIPLGFDRIRRSHVSHKVKQVKHEQR